MRRQFERAGMVDFIPGEWPDLIGGDSGQRHGVAIVGGELDHESFAALDYMDDRANVTRHQPIFRQARGQRYAIKFSYHVQDIIMRTINWKVSNLGKLETKSGRKVVTNENYLSLTQTAKKTKRIRT